MAKRTRMKFQAANEFGETLSKAAAYSLTEDNILQDGYQFIKLSTGKLLTLPAASLDLDGIVIRVNCAHANDGVYVAAGFGGGITSYDTVQPGAYCTVDFWCNGTYWYALSESVKAAVA